MLGVWPFDGKHIRLLIVDPNHTSYTLPIYINPNTMAYPLGLIPGSRVVFYKLERKLSAQGKVYAQFTNASTCRVVGRRDVEKMESGTR